MRKTSVWKLSEGWREKLGLVNLNRDWEVTLRGVMASVLYITLWKKILTWRMVKIACAKRTGEESPSEWFTSAVLPQEGKWSKCHCAWNLCAPLWHLRVKTQVPVSDSCTVQTFTFFQGKCIQEWLDSLPWTGLAATFFLFCGLLLEQMSVPPLLLLKYRPVSGRPDLWDGKSLFAQGIVEQWSKTTSFHSEKFISISNSHPESHTFSTLPVPCE